MRGSVDEVRHCNQSSSKPYDGAIDSGYEDLAVRVEGLGNVEVVGSEGLEPLFELLVGGTFVLAGGRDVRTAVNNISFRGAFVCLLGWRGDSRAEETTCACQDCDEDVVAAIDVAH